MAVVFVSFLTCLSFCFLACASEEREPTASVKFTPGKAVILPCQDPKNSSVTTFEWTKTDLGDQYVFFYRDNHPDPDNQHPSFTDRVKLSDSSMTRGNVSLILNDPKDSDSGTYKCHIISRNTNRRKRATLDAEVIYTVKLTLDNSGHTEEGGNKDGEKNDGNSRGYIMSALSVCAIITVIASASAVAYRRFRRSKGDTKKNPLHPPTNEASEQLV